MQHVGETPSGAERSDKHTERRLCHQSGSRRCMGLRRAVLASNLPPLSIIHYPSSIPASEVSKVNLMSERRIFVLDMEG